MIKKSVLFATVLLTSVSPLVLASDILNVESDSKKQQQTRLPGIGEFPNYFDYLESKERLHLVEQSFASILAGLQIPHHTEPNTALEYDDFFKKIVELVHKQDPGAKVYVAGGMVRSLLGYDYKKLYRAVERSLIQANESGKNPDPTDTIVKNTLLRLTKEQPTKRRHFLKTLGISSDFDILIDFSESLTDNIKYSIIKLVTHFINSAQSFLGLTKDKSKIKKSVVPVGDVQDYQKQIGTKGDRSAVLQGGLTLDWLAFDLVEHKIRMPDDHQDILDVFFKSNLQYLTGKDGTPTPDKQTIRALRPLLEIPFSRYDEAGEIILDAELRALCEKGLFSSEAEEQIEKMIRNAREGSAHNLLAKPERGTVNLKVRQSAKQLSDKFKSKNTKILPPAAEFLETKNIQLRRDDKGDLKSGHILMSVEDFITKHTENGTVQHGTPDLINVINMMRNGFLVSKSGQGIAACGRGFYTAKDVSTAQTYAKEEGIVVPLQINVHKNLRILDLNSPAAKKFADEVEKKFPTQDINEVLTNEYDIDIIIDSYILIQNAAALKKPKDIKVLIKAQMDKTEIEIADKLKSNPDYSNIRTLLHRWMQHVHPKKGFAQLFICLGGEPSKKGLGVLEEYLEKQVQNGNENAAHFLLSNQAAFKNSDSALGLVDKYIRSKSNFNFRDDFIARWYAIQDQQSLDDIGLDDLIVSFQKDYVADKTYNSSALLKAVQANNYEAVEYLVAAGAALDSCDFFKETAVSIASQHNNVKILTCLAEAGANLDSRNGSGRTPLSTAASYGNLEAMAFLVDRKVNVDTKDSVGKSVLCIAAINGKLDAVQALVQKGADRLALDNEGLTTFGNALSRGKTDVAEYLSSLGNVDILEKDVHGNSLLALAAFNGCLDVVKELHQKGLKIDDTNEHGITPLSLAARNGKLDVLQYLVSNQVDLNIRNADGCTPLEGAVSGGHLDCAKFMVENGANINTKNNKGDSLLSLATQRDSVVMVKYLVELGLDINDYVKVEENSQEAAGDSLIGWAAGKNDNELVQLLIERGADTNAVLKDGQPLLAWAVEKEHTNVLKTLALRGMDFSYRNASGQTLMQIAMKISFPKPEMILILLENGGDIKTKDRNDDSLISWAASQGSVGIVKFLLGKGESIESTNRYGDTPFISAIAGDNLELLKYLVDSGVNRHAKDNNNDTGLHDAARMNKLAVVKFLLEQGLDPKAVNDQGETPYMTALKFKSAEVIEYLEAKEADIITPGDPADQLLKYSIKDGNLPSVTALIKIGIPIDRRTKYGVTVLNSAIMGGQLDMLKWLVKMGANINETDASQNTYLHDAADINGLAIVKYLLEQGLDPKAVNASGETPYMRAVGNQSTEVIAHFEAIQADTVTPGQPAANLLTKTAEKGSLQLFKALIKRGTSIDSRDKDEQTPLMKAALWGHLDLLKFLLDEGANKHAKDQFGATSLHKACSLGRTEVAQMLVEIGLDPNEKDKFGKTPLFSACKYKEIFEYLLKNGADITVIDNDGCNLAHYCAKNDLLNELKFVIDKGVDINAKDKFGHAILSLAAREGSVQVITWLLDQSVDLEQANYSGETALMVACIAGKTKAAELLLNKGANLHTTDKDGKTLLGRTANTCRVENLKLILSKGFQVDTKDRAGCTAFRLACDAANTTSMEFLLNNGAQIDTQDLEGNTPLGSTVKNMRNSWDGEKLILFLIEKQANVNARNNAGETPLTLAVNAQYEDAIEKLLFAGADPNIADNNGLTPLCHAAISGNTRSFEMLASKGADITIKDNAGLSPLYHAAIHKHSSIVDYLLEKINLSQLSELEKAALLSYTALRGYGNINYVQELLDRGFSINAKDANGRTPISHVAERGRLEMFQFLENQGADLSIEDNNGKKPTDHVFSSVPDVNIVQYLTQKGIALNYKDKGSVYLLNAAIEKNDLTLARELIAIGVDINAGGEYGFTPLGTAAKSGSVVMVELLLSHNVELNKEMTYKGGTSGTPLSQAKSLQNIFLESNKPTQTYLAQHDNNLYATADADTPPEILILRNLKKVIDILEAKGAK